MGKSSAEHQSYRQRNGRRDESADAYQEARRKEKREKRRIRIKMQQKHSREITA
jgi:hypothetical protein